MEVSRMEDGAFVLTERHKAEYAANGYTVFEACLPPVLIDDLRQECDELAAEARRQGGPQAQRLTKILGTAVDPAPFDLYAQLPSLKAAFKELIGEQCEHGSHMFWTPEQEEYHAGHGVMIEPTEVPYCTVWHRDWRDNVSGLPLEEWERVCTDRRYFNQTNLPLYADSCFWVVRLLQASYRSCTHRFRSFEPSLDTRQSPRLGLRAVWSSCAEMLAIDSSSRCRYPDRICGVTRPRKRASSPTGRSGCHSRPRAAAGSRRRNRYNAPRFDSLSLCMKTIVYQDRLWANAKEQSKKGEWRFLSRVSAL